MILALCVAAVASGAKSVYAISDYVADTGPELLALLGLPASMSSGATLHRVIVSPGDRGPERRDLLPDLRGMATMPCADQRRQTRHHAGR